PLLKRFSARTWGIVVAAGAIAFIEDRIGKPEFREQRAPQIDVGAGSWNGGIEIETSVEVAPEVSDIGEREIDAPGKLALNGEVPLIHRRKLLLHWEVCRVDSIRKRQEPVLRNGWKYRRRRRSGQRKRGLVRRRGGQGLSDHGWINVSRKVVEGPAESALKVTAAVAGANDSLGVQRVRNRQSG